MPDPDDFLTNDTLLNETLPHFETICTHWGENPALNRGAATPPIYQNSLFTFPDCATREGNYTLTPGAGPNTAGAISQFYDYSRVSNPTTDIAEAKIAELEGAERARCCSSGMGAISGAILSCVKAGDHVIAPSTSYGPTRQFLSDYLLRFGVTVTYVNGDDPQHYAEALLPNTKLLYLESPSSVVMRQQDLAAVAKIARDHGAATICDNSWASPIFQRPLSHGVDMVVHSATKYLGGHSDIVAGVIAGSAARIRRLTLTEGCLLGACMDPFAAWLLIRGLRTLPIRMERHEKNARFIVQRLREHPAVEFVLYPGQPDDPQRDLTCRQLRGTSGLFSFALREDGKAATHRFVDALHYFGIGCSWGGFESLALPATASRPVLGLEGDGHRWLVRLHIGLETSEDLWQDIEQALG
jgi:cystathionine beta-lyase